jgi:hypothetical protein
MGEYRNGVWVEDKQCAASCDIIEETKQVLDQHEKKVDEQAVAAEKIQDNKKDTE